MLFITLSVATVSIVTPTIALVSLAGLVEKAVFSVPANSFAEEDTSDALLKTVFASSENTSSTFLMFLFTVFVCSIA